MLCFLISKPHLGESQAGRCSGHVWFRLFRPYGRSPILRVCSWTWFLRGAGGAEGVKWVQAFRDPLEQWIGKAGLRELEVDPPLRRTSDPSARTLFASQVPCFSLRFLCIIQSHLEVCSALFLIWEILCLFRLNDLPCIYHGLLQFIFSITNSPITKQFIPSLMLYK